MAGRVDVKRKKKVVELPINQRAMSELYSLGTELHAHFDVDGDDGDAC